MTLQNIVESKLSQEELIQQLCCICLIFISVITEC